jgi:hypothetical protein
MNQLERDFKSLINRLQNVELCKEVDPRLLHGFWGIASEACEIFEMHQNGQALISRTEMLIEISDILHFMEYPMIVLDVSIEDLVADCEGVFVPFAGYSGMVIEAGNLLNRYKKFAYYHGEIFSRKDMIRGLSRLYRCVETIILLQDSSIEEVMAINMAKLTARYPEKQFDHECGMTQNRDKEVEKAAVEAVIAEYAKLREPRKSSSIPFGKDGRIDNS